MQYRDPSARMRAPARSALLAVAAVAVLGLILLGAGFVLALSRRTGLTQDAVPPGVPAADGCDETRSVDDVQLADFPTSHPLVTLLGLAVLVTLLLVAGGVFTLSRVVNLLPPLQPVIAFLAWMTGLGPANPFPG